MRQLMVWAVLLLTAVQLNAQEKDHAVIRNWDIRFSMSSPQNGTCKVVKEIQVLDEDGEAAALFLVNTDSFTSLSSFSGTISHGGKVISKLKKTDLVSQSLSSGLAEDEYAVYYVPSATYPYTVRYEYSVSYRKGVAHFPVFMPVDEERVSVDQARYEISVPSGTAIQYYAPYSDPEVSHAGGHDLYTWQVGHLPGFIAEHQMPSPLEFLPFVLAAPCDFTYGGSSGSQRTWQDVARWHYDLQKGSDDLPEDFRAKVREMTAGCTTTQEKVRVIYRYLRDNTRYVSIQYGLGGYKPFPASTVVKTGFGDCKALVNFMRAMLAEAGVPSDYLILNTDRADFFPGFSSFGQMNHVMLAVPVPEQADTLWIECTNPKYPLGYRHSSIAGHQVVMVREGDGGMIRVPAYPDSLRRTSVQMRIHLHADGSASMTACKDLFLSDAEPYIGFEARKPEEQARSLTAAMVFHPEHVRVTGIRDNFSSAGTADFVPRISIDYTMDTGSYAQVSSNRLFVPFNPVAQAMTFQRSERKYDLVVRSGYAREDVIRTELPEGFRLESLPAPVDLTEEWADFHAFSSVDGQVLTTVVRYVFKPCRLPKERYTDFRDFARKINRAMDTRIVLVRE